MCVARETSRVSTIQANARRRPKMCNGDEMYVPLNDGFNWKEILNATTSGRGCRGSTPSRRRLRALRPRLRRPPLRRP